MHNRKANPDAATLAGIERAALAALAPPSTEPAWRWCERNMTLDASGPMPGRYDTGLTPQARWVYDATQQRKVRRVVVMVSAQSAKTQLALGILNHRVVNDPSPIMWVMASADHMQEFVKKRLAPSLENCPPVAALLPIDRTKWTRGLIQFRSCNLILRGSNSRAKLQSDPVRLIICDERREWKPGAIDLLRKRTRTFHNSLEISLGTAGVENDALHTDWKEGTQTVAHFHCPACQHSQPFRFGRRRTSIYRDDRDRGGLVWTTDEATKPGGRWDWAAVAKSVRYECEACGHQIRNAEKLALIRTIHPVDYNPGAAVRSFHWNALSMLWADCDWGQVAVEFLRATDAARLGNVEPLRAFITETLGEPWQDELGAVADWGFLEGRRGEYAYGDGWPEETVRFMAADRQEAGGEHYWWVVRAFAPGGRSRLIAHGRAPGTAELEEARARWNVPAGNAVLDTGWRPTDCYRFCQARGWRAFKGDQARYYLAEVMRPDGKTESVRRLWKPTWADPALGTGLAGKVKPIRLFLWSNDGTKDLMGDFMAGLVGEWTFPKNTSREYLEQVTAERRVEKADQFGRLTFTWQRARRDNHYFDCECMILVAAIVSKTFVHNELPEPKKS